MLEITPQERLALTVFALLLGGGGMARHAVARAELRAGMVLTAEAADSLHSAERSPLLSAVEEELERERIRRTPLQPGERIDPNTASPDELARLPRIGPALAARIVADREQGRFHTLDDLGRVRGIGPALLEGLAPHITLPATPRGAPPAVNGASSARTPAGRTPRIDLNRANFEELQQLPGIGPALAARIIEHRRLHGPFRTLTELEAVSGIGPRLRERLEGLVRLGT